MFEKDYVVRGKHAHYLKYLNAFQRKMEPEQYGKNAGIFPAAIDIYVVAPLIGAAYNRIALPDYDSQDTVNIHADAIIRRQRDLATVYRLIMLIERQSEATEEERVKRAFRDDEDEAKLSENIELFHQFMRGGLEWLYEQVTEHATTQEDYLKRIVELVNQYSVDFDLTELTGNVEEI